jgi:hypothetical protein
LPDDASLIVVAGPWIDFPNEIEASEKTLAKAGKVRWLDPPDKPTSPPITNLVALAHVCASMSARTSWPTPWNGN